MPSTSVILLIFMSDIFFLFLSNEGCFTFMIHHLDQRSKLGVLRPVQQPGSYWDRSSELPLVGLEPTEVTAYD